MHYAKNLAYSLAHIWLWLQWMLDQAPRLPCPQHCAFSHVPITPFERRALMCLHNVAITSTIPRQINQRQHNSQIQRIPKLRSDSITLRQMPREGDIHIYRKANFNCANLKKALAVMDWVHFGKNCYFLPHYHPSSLHQCCHKVPFSQWPDSNLPLNTQLSDFTARALQTSALLLCCAPKGLLHCCRIPLPRKGLFCD